MVTPWDDSVKNRNPKQLSVFATTNVKGPWRRALDDALVEFNRLSQLHKLGIIIAAPQNATAPDPSNEDGADIQFDLGSGTLTFTAFDQDFQVNDFSGTGLHGLTELVSRQFGKQAKRARRAFIFVPENPLIEAHCASAPIIFGNYIFDYLTRWRYNRRINRGLDDEQVHHQHLPAFRDVPGSGKRTALSGSSALAAWPGLPRVRVA